MVGRSHRLQGLWAYFRVDDTPFLTMVSNVSWLTVRIPSTYNSSCDGRKIVNNLLKVEVEMRCMITNYEALD